MDCPWRRTVASVFLLLSSHNVRVLSQNVGPAGLLPPLPLQKEPARDCIDLNSVPGQQQMNFIPGPPNYVLKEFAPLNPYASEYQRIPEYFRPAYSQAQLFNSVPQASIGPFPQGPGFNIPQINSLPPLQGPLYNPLPTTNVPSPQGPPINTKPAPLVPIPPPLQGLSPNISPIPLAPIQQGPSCNTPPVINSLVPQGLQSNISPVPLVTTSQGQILPGPQVPIAPNTGLAWNVPPNLQNQNIQTFPSVTTSYPQPFVPPVGTPCTVTTDLTSLGFSPTPNLPAPLQNNIPIPQTPIQPVVYPQPIVPADCLPNTSVSPNYQISALPPVFPLQLCDNSGKLQTVTDEFSPVPINIQINVPSPTIPEPKITIITAYPSPPASPVPVPTTDNSDVSFGMYPPFPLPPIIIEGRRSRSRSWLPLILIALFARDDYCGSGRYCCCCPCNFASADIPIPYPIPIPTNNPIIVGNSCRSRKRAPKDKKND